MRTSAKAAAGRGVSYLSGELVLLAVTGAVGLAFGVGAAFQTATLEAVEGSSHAAAVVSFVARTAVNSGTVLLVLAIVNAARLGRWRTRRFLLVVPALGVVAGFVRVSLQFLAHLELHDGWRDACGEGVVTVVVVALCLLIGKYAGDVSERLQREELRARQQSERASAALEALHAEEIRVRRDVADGLHGGVQQRLVLIGIRLRDIAADLNAGVPGRDVAAAVAELQGEVERLREVDLRGLTRLLYPDALEIGLAPAVRSMVRRIPASIAVELAVDEAVAHVESAAVPDLRRRLMLVRVVEEGISNALRHGHASRIRVRLAVEDGQVRAEVDDNGQGVAPSAHLRGLERLRERLEFAGGWLRLERSDSLGGALLRAQLPLGAAATI